MLLPLGKRAVTKFLFVVKKFVNFLGGGRSGHGRRVRGQIR